MAEGSRASLWGGVLPGAWRVSKPQSGGGARETPRTVSAGGLWLDPGHAGVGEFCCATRFSGILRLVSTSFRPNFPPSRVNRNLAEIFTHLSFFHSFWPFSASFFGRLDFGCSLSVWASLRFASMFSPSSLVSTARSFIYTRETKTKSRLRYEKARAPIELKE